MSSATSPRLALPRPSRARRVTFDLDRLKEASPLTGLLVLTALLYLWALSRNGWANEYYAAAAQAGTHSWKAFLFGSLDASNYITVDKPPASLWLRGQISWLLPAAMIVLFAGAAWTARRPRSDRTRAALLLWGGWLVVTAGGVPFHVLDDRRDDGLRPHPSEEGLMAAGARTSAHAMSKRLRRLFLVTGALAFSAALYTETHRVPDQP